MAILADNVRAERRILIPTLPSIREVCLVGVSHPESGWGSRRGERVICSGRVYRVEASRARAGHPSESPRYVYLGLGDDEAPD